MTTSNTFNPRLRDEAGSPLAAPSRGSTARPDFRKAEDAEDPSAVTSEAMARSQDAADRRGEAIARDQVRQAEVSSSPSADRRVGELERAVRSLEADAIVMRQRIATLEAAQPAKPSVSQMPRKGGGDVPPRAA